MEFIIERHFIRVRINAAIFGSLILFSISAFCGQQGSWEARNVTFGSALKKISDTTKNFTSAKQTLDKKDAKPEEKQAAEAVIDKSKTDMVALEPMADRDTRVGMGLANFWLQAEEYKRATVLASKAIARARQENEQELLLEALKTRALAYGAQRQFDRAQSDAERILKLSPEDRDAWAIIKLTKSRGPRAAGDENDPALRGEVRALAAARQPSVVNRSAGFASSVAHSKDADTAMKLADFEEMDRKAALAIEQFPENPKAYMQRAFAALMLRRYDKVLAATEAGLKLAPNSASLLGLRAAALNETGKPRQALAAAQKAVDVNPKDAFAWLQKGLAREKSGEPDDQYLADIKQAADLNPEFENSYVEALARRGRATIKPTGGAGAAAGPGDAASAPRRGLGDAAAWIKGLGARALGAQAAGARWPGGGHSAGRAAAAAVVLIVLTALGAALLRRGAAAGPKGVIGGCFRLERQIGRGGMGQVWRAWDGNLERAVAIKRLGDNLKDDPQEAARLVREAKTVAGLKHPNIVAIYDAFSDGGEYYLVFELVSGETVLDRMGRHGGKLPLQECLRLLGPVCAALDYAHSQRVIHRDLKPNNIMVENGAVKVMDFGIARRTQNPGGPTRTQTVAGTPEFMAPEQHLGEVSRESDLFSLGVCAYPMLTGELPFAGDAAAKLEGRFRPASAFGLPAGLDAVFGRALAPDRTKRFHSAAELFAALREASAANA